jgi:hypothetical protein
MLLFIVRVKRELKRVYRKLDCSTFENKNGMENFTSFGGLWREKRIVSKGKE